MLCTVCRGGACGTYWERSGAYRVLVEKTEVRRPYGRPGRVWEFNIEMNLKEIRPEDEDCIDLA